MGGVIPCWDNQLFDADLDTCTTWQSVEEKGNMAERCPNYDGSLMMPELTDENANPDRFFCGVSSSNARRVCEPCPGGSRLECSDPSHNCFAGVTGCPVNPPSSPSSPSTYVPPPPTPNTPSTSGSPPNPSAPPHTGSPPTPTAPNAPSTAGSPNAPTTAGSPTAPSEPSMPTFLLNFPTPNPTKNPTNNPTNRPTNHPTNGLAIINIDNDEFDTIADSLVENNEDDELYLDGYIRSSYFCGYSWDFVIRSCETSSPCESGLNSQCPMGQTCFPGTPCAEILKEKTQPTPKPTHSPITKQQQGYFCGFDWDWVVDNCHTTTPCPGGDAYGVCDEGMNCIADTPCPAILKGGPTPLPTTPPTRHPTFPPVESDDESKRFCGFDWADVTENCLTATPCPGGDARICPDGMNCIAETPCTDEEYLDWLRQKQASNGSGNDVANPSSGEKEACATNDQCSPGEFCNYGFCGECSILDNSNHMGCSTDQVCKTAGCQVVQAWGRTRCYNIADLDIECEDLTGISGSTCNTDKMICEFGSVAVNNDNDGVNEEVNGLEEKEEDFNAGSTGALFDNPEGNTFFCGFTYYAILDMCLQSKPCPGGFGTGICADDEGCFNVEQCQNEYQAATEADSPQFQPSTSSLSNGPTSSPQTSLSTSPPTPQSSIQPTKTEPTTPSINLSQSPTKGSTKSPNPDPTSAPSSSPSSTLISIPIDSDALVASGSPTKMPIPISQVTFSTKSPVSTQPSILNDAGSPTTPPPTTKPTFPFPTIPYTTESPTSGFLSPNSNFCGVTWSSHTQDCENALPCPIGDECPTGQTCFNNSPCAQTSISVEGNSTADSKIRNVCGSEWNALLVECLSATPCPLGNECGEGKFCYRDFVCDPPDITSTSTTSTITPLSNATIGSNEVVGAQSLTESTTVSGASSGNDQAKNQNDGSNQTQQEVVGGSANSSTHLPENNNSQSSSEPDGVVLEPCGICGNAGHIDSSNTVQFNGTDISCGDFDRIFSSKNIKEGSNKCLTTRESYFGSCCVSDEPSEALLEPCDICGTAGQIDWSKTIQFNGTNISCGEFGWIFSSSKIYEGSNQCLRMRASYFGSCCFSTPQDGCNLCGVNAEGNSYELRTDVSIEFDGEALSCVEASYKISSKFEATSATCANAQVTHFSDCCFQKCSLCGDSLMDWEASVFFSGKQMPCYEFDKVFQDDGISEGSNNCDLTRDLYKKECCIDPPDVPCNLCQSGSTYYQMNSDAIVSYDGTPFISCLEVYSSLFSRREQSSEHCIKTKGELFPQCCDESTGLDLSVKDPVESTGSTDSSIQQTQGVGNNFPSPSSDRGDFTNSGSNSPTTTYSTWAYTGDLSPASTKVLSIGCIAVGTVLWALLL